MCCMVSKRFDKVFPHSLIRLRIAFISSVNETKHKSVPIPTESMCASKVIKNTQTTCVIMAVKKNPIGSFQSNGNLNKGNENEGK